MVAGAVPDAPAHIQGDRVVTWRDTDRRANALAADLLDAGPASRRRSPPTSTTAPSTWRPTSPRSRPGSCPVNTNYRYGPDELVYLFDNADAEAVVFHAAFADLLDADPRPAAQGAALVRGRRRQRRARLGRRRTKTSPAPAPTAPTPRGAASGDDLLLLYTGGTTGMPKGVMWRQDDLFNVLGAGGNAVPRRPAAAEPRRASPRRSQPALVTLPALPADARHRPVLGVHRPSRSAARCARSTTATSTPPSCWRTVERRRAHRHRHRRPGLRPPDARRPRRRARPLRPVEPAIVISSSGVMWSHENKQALADAHARGAALRLARLVGSGRPRARRSPARGMAAQTAKFALGEHVAVFTDDGRRGRARLATRSASSPSAGHARRLLQGRGEDGRARSAPSTACAGAIPGDFATVDADGTIHLLGRGSVCINTGGEKVFPEEVEEVLKTHPRWWTRSCVGVPDERFGEAISAVVEADRRSRRGRRDRFREAAPGVVQGAAVGDRGRQHRPQPGRQGRLRGLPRDRSAAPRRLRVPKGRRPAGGWDARNPAAVRARQGAGCSASGASHVIETTRPHRRGPVRFQPTWTLDRAAGRTPRRCPSPARGGRATRPGTGGS